jgi:hypothetical protein
LITHLIAIGKRVGVASQSHKAIHKLLQEVEADALAVVVAFRALKKATSGGEESYYEGRGLAENGPVAEAFFEAETSSSRARAGSSRARSSTGRRSRRCGSPTRFGASSSWLEL